MDKWVDKWVDKKALFNTDIITLSNQNKVK